MIPDDRNIKTEIESISKRIDNIIKTVTRVIPDHNFERCLESTGTITGTVDGKDGNSKVTEQSTQKAE